MTVFSVLDSGFHRNDGMVAGRGGRFAKRPYGMMMWHLRLHPRAYAIRPYGGTEGGLFWIPACAGINDGEVRE